MAEYPGGNAGLLDLGISVEHPANPPKIHITGMDRAPSQHNRGGAAIVRHCVKDSAWVTDTLVDDFNAGNHEFGGPQHIEQSHAGTAQRRAQNESQFDLDAWDTEAVVRKFYPVIVHHVIEEMAIVRFVDLRRPLHRL